MTDLQVIQMLYLTDFSPTMYSTSKYVRMRTLKSWKMKMNTVKHKGGKNHISQAEFVGFKFKDFDS